MSRFHVQPAFNFEVPSQMSAQDSPLREKIRYTVPRVKKLAPGNDFHNAVLESLLGGTLTWTD